MEAKATMMNDEEIEAAHRTLLYSENEASWIHQDRAVAKAQAEISFKAGIREVVEFIETMQPLEFNGMWQAKLKEWGIK